MFANTWSLKVANFRSLDCWRLLEFLIHRKGRGEERFELSLVSIVLFTSCYRSFLALHPT